MNRVRPHLEALRREASAAAQVENLCYEKVARGCPCPGDGVAGRATQDPIGTAARLHRAEYNRNRKYFRRRHGDTDNDAGEYRCNFVTRRWSWHHEHHAGFGDRTNS